MLWTYLSVYSIVLSEFELFSEEVSILTATLINKMGELLSVLCVLSALSSFSVQFFSRFYFQQRWWSSSLVRMNLTVPSFTRTQPPFGSWLSKVNNSGPPCWFQHILVSNKSTISLDEFGSQFVFICGK